MYPIRGSSLQWRSRRPQACPSGIAEFRSLSLLFLPTNDHIEGSQPSTKHVVLPSPIVLDYRGITKYLEDFVAGIQVDAPRLGESDLSQLGEFVDLIGIPKGHRHAHITCSEGTISLSFIQPGVPTCIELQVLCERLSKQLSSLAEVCIHLYAFLYDVEGLRISATRQPRREDYFYPGQCLKSINSFTGVKYFHLAGGPTIDIVAVRALRQAKMRPRTTLPVMYELYIPEPGNYRALLMKEVASLMTSRRLSGDSGPSMAVEFERLRELRGTGTILRSATTLLANTSEQLPFLSRCRSRISATTSF